MNNIYTTYISLTMPKSKTRNGQRIVKIKIDMLLNLFSVGDIITIRMDTYGFKIRRAYIDDKQTQIVQKNKTIRLSSNPVHENNIVGSYECEVEDEDTLMLTKIK